MYEFNLWGNSSENDLFGQSVSAIDYRDIFVGMREVPLRGSDRAGYFKEPFGREETTSSNDITFMERSLTDAFIERRNLGVMFQRRFTAKRRMTTALGFYRSADNDLETGTGYGVTGRVTGAPATSERLAVSIQVGDAESYSPSLAALLDELVDIADDAGSRTFTLKQEHLRNLALAADPITGKAYLVVVTEVLYMRSREATIRQRDTPLVPDDEPPASVPRPIEPEEGERSDPEDTDDVGEWGDSDRAVAAIRRAQALNEAVCQLGVADDHE